MSGEAPSPLAGSRVLLDERALADAVARIARDITEVYGERRELTLVAVLHGALVFTADLLRALPMPVQLETVTASSYRRDARRPGDLVLRMDDKQHLRGRHVLLVDDILDTGGTLARLRAEVAGFEPASLRVAVLLDKPARRAADVRADFVGHAIPDLFVVGYGLDLDGRYRNLPQILALQPEEVARAEEPTARASEARTGDARANDARSRSQPGAGGSSSSSTGAGRVTKSTQPS